MTTNVQSYETIGRKENISDFMAMITPTKTPFTSSIKSEKIHNTVVQWLEDSLRAPGANALVEGADAVDINVTQPAMRANQTQIFGASFRIADTMTAVSTYGRAREHARNLYNTGAEIKRDHEHAAVGTAQAGAAGSASVARTMASVQAMIDPATTVAAAGAVLNEDRLLAALKLVFDAGGDVDTISIPSKDALKVANFAQASGRTRDIAAGNKLVNAISIYVDPYGTSCKIVVNRQQLPTSVLLYNTDNWKSLTLRPWNREVLAKTGDSTRTFIVGEYSLKHTAFKASAMISGLSAS